MGKRRVIVTRTAAQAPALCDKLRQAGFKPIPFPTIQLEPLPVGPLDAALARLGSFDWLIFSSSNGVDFFFRRVDALKRLAPSQEWGSLPFPKIAAVGSATAQKLAQRQIQPNFVPDSFVGESLAAGLGDLTGQRVLLPRAKQGRPQLVHLLQKQGADVMELPLYETVTAVPTPQEWDSLAQGFEAITFTSPSSVRNFLMIIDGGRPDRFDRTEGSQPVRSIGNATIACIGPITAAAARDAGLTVAIMPKTYTTDGMVDALTSYFAQIGSILKIEPI
jgi:uroporphyrinogen-III synthase